MAKVKHIQVNELPAQLEANAIYFVRNTGEIWQTDDNGVGVKMGVGMTIPYVIEYGGNWKLYNGYYYYLNYQYGWNSTSVAKMDSLDTLTKVVEANSALGKSIPTSGYRLSKISINYACAIHSGIIKIRVFSKRFRKNIKFACSSSDILDSYQLLADIEFDTIHFRQEYMEFYVNSDYELEEGDIIVPILIAETGDYINLGNVTLKLKFKFI